MAYEGDTIDVNASPATFAESLGQFTFSARSGRGYIQTYLTRDELAAHVEQCLALLYAA